MILNIENEYLRVAISSHGAEVQSIVNKKTGYEYLWNADARFWKRHSPVLFPIVGSVWQKTYRMDGKEYTIGQHGFARDMEFRAPEKAVNGRWSFVLDSDAETLKLFPRCFELQIHYSLEGKTLNVGWTVINRDEKDMDFQIGAHPAFMMPDFNPKDAVHGYFGFEVDNLESEELLPDGSIGTGMHKVMLEDDRLLPITEHTFDCGTYIFNDRRLTRISLLDTKRNKVVRVCFDAPYVGLWSPSPECPFVCIEPWYGRADYHGYDGDFHDRPAVTTLAPGESRDFCYQMEF